jgi:hypothetical protein
MVLERPEIPLHTNGSENDIRCHVTRRKLSGGTRSDDGRDCRDTPDYLRRSSLSAAQGRPTVVVWVSRRSKMTRCRHFQR